jgi:hypothetical protein
MSSIPLDKRGVIDKADELPRISLNLTWQHPLKQEAAAWICSLQ